MTLRPFERWKQAANCLTLVWLDMKSETGFWESEPSG